MSKKSKQRKEAKSEGVPKQATTKSGMKPGSGNGKLYLILLLVLTSVLFYPSVKYQLVNWDDNINLFENKTLEPFSETWKWENVKTIFTSDIMGNYNPLPIFTFAVEKYFFASDPLESPGIFHFNNVWMHVVCTLLVFLLFRRLGLDALPAFFGAALFGIHPMRVESVAWVTERKDVLYALFFIASLLTYLRFTRESNHPYRWYALTLFLSVFSYFAKIQAVTLPLSMVALDFLTGRKWYSFKVLILEKLPWWGLSLAFGLINIYFLSHAEIINSGGTAVFTFLDRLAIGAYSYFIYLVKFVYPYVMAPMYSYPPKIPMTYFIALAIIPLAIALFLIRAWKRKQKHAIFGWAFFTFNVMFLLQILTAGQAFLADRFTYVAYIGLFFLAAYGIQYASRKNENYKTAIWGFAALYLVFCAYTTSVQIQVWENSGTLWGKEIAEYPNVPEGYINAGKYFNDQKDRNLAKEYYLKAISLEPNHVMGRTGLSKVYFDIAFGITGNSIEEEAKVKLLLDSALMSYKIALANDSIAGDKLGMTRAEILINRGACYTRLGNFDAALKDYAAGLAIDPKNENGYANRALIYINTNQYDKAVKDFDAYLLLKPNKSNMYYERAVCKFKLNKYDEALKDVNTAFAMGDNRPLYYLGRAQIYKAMGNLDAMRKDALVAKQNGLAVPADLLQ